jgi:threonylcarbamoyladenosine tRNA methylthiotransferase MtaB
MNEITKAPTIALDSLGCKLNQAEIQTLARQLETAGYRLVDPSEKADIYILNTCSVTHVADRKSRHLLRLARRRSPSARLIAIGCYAHRAPAELAKIDGVELVLGNDRKMNLLNLLGVPANPQDVLTPPSGPHAVRRTRAFLKVQDGCKNYCAYCIVPFVRSRIQNVPAEKIIAFIKGFVANGYREVVLTGTEIGSYECSGGNLEGLIRRVLADTPITRLRLSSLQPHQILPALVSLGQNSRLCPHFHLSLQSGSDAVLKRMKRRYSIAGYRKAVQLIRDSIPDVAITSDVIVGFPGETDTEFQETLHFCHEMRFARIHVFPFSPRPATTAASMPGQVPAAIIKKRVDQMLSLAQESARLFQQQFLGRTLDVLWEQQTRGVWSGLTGNYIKVYARSNDVLTNLILPVKLLKPYRDGVYGEM